MRSSLTASTGAPTGSGADDRQAWHSPSGVVVKLTRSSSSRVSFTTPTAISSRALITCHWFKITGSVHAGFAISTVSFPF